MRKQFEPQIVFVYNKIGQIIKTYFLTFDPDSLTTSKHYELFLYFQSTDNLFLNKDYSIIEDHILLTLNLDEARGYIQKRILQTDLKILLFSYWSNIDYIDVNNRIFNPFNSETVYRKNNGETVLYDAYNNIATITIFSVLDENNAIKKELCSNGIYNENIYTFVKTVMNEDISNFIDLEIIYNKPQTLQYNINISNELLHALNNLTNYDKIINEYSRDNIYISGDRFFIKYVEEDYLTKDNNDFVFIMVLKKNTQFVFNKDKLGTNNVIFTIFGNLLIVNDFLEYQNIIEQEEIFKNSIINQKIIKQNIKIEYNIQINANLNISDNDLFLNDYFFIETTKNTKNIYTDRSKRINIMTSSNHIYFTTYYINYDLFQYITKIIIGLQSSVNQIQFMKNNKKIGIRYFSRYCQGIRNPVPIEEGFDLTDYNNFNNIFFEHVFNEGDIYFDNTKKKYFICDKPNLTNIGFINEIYQGYNQCFPCCYKKSKQSSDIFRACISGGITAAPVNELIHPYIHIFKQYRVIMNKIHIGLLLTKLNNIFNKDVKILLQKKSKLKEIDIGDSKLIDIEISKNNYFNYNLYKIKGSPIFYKSEGTKLNENSKISKKISTNIKNTKTREVIYKNELRNFYQYFDSLKVYLVINQQNRIELANNFIIYMTNSGEVDLNSIEDIKNVEEPIIYFLNDVAHFNLCLIRSYNTNKELFFKNLKFYLIIQNKIHILRSINKLTLNSDLKVTDLTPEFKKKIFYKIVDIDDIIINKTFDNIIYNNAFFQIDDTKFYYDDYENSKYILFEENISLNPSSIGYYITDILYKDYFDLICCNKKHLNNIKIVFLHNLNNLTNNNFIFNKRFNFDIHKDSIKKIIPYLNKKYINSKEKMKFY